MKSVLDLKNVVKISYPDSYTLEYNTEGLKINGVLNKKYIKNNSKVVTTTEPPTPLYSDIYEWKNSQWIMLDSINNMIERIYAKCEQLISGEPQGTPEEWQAYVERVNEFKASILQTVSPFGVKIRDYDVPGSIYLWELRSVLKAKGLNSQVETAINSLPSEIKDSALEAWNHATTIKRYSPTVKLIQSALNLSTYEVDEIFRSAQKISI